MKRILTPFAIAALALSLAACGSDSDDNDESNLVSSGKLTVCSEVPYPPFEIEDPDSPSGYTGFDMDIVQYIADEMDLELSVVPTSFTAIDGASALNASQCDLAASAITINDDRKPNMEFSDGYFTSAQTLLVPEGSPVKELADLEGKKIGVQSSTTGETYANENATGADIVAFEGDSKMFQALKAKTVDALLQDIGPNRVHQDDGGFVIVEEYDGAEEYGFAMKKGNTELVEDVNEALQEMRDSGEYDTVYAKYFD
ncbi:transporter substrate-binding domain-containing protein [Nocardioides gilvus]|uniref:transporter substrate-binding domain-containing protein n=1 Tax=Nocardioides gilvus TaxID=1735589 RepID=UPI000D745C86|nr:transporter substrate-binding domain-containing protein [Nocardioides gilvus]